MTSRCSSDVFEFVTLLKGEQSGRIRHLRERMRVAWQLSDGVFDFSACDTECRWKWCFSTFQLKDGQLHRLVDATWLVDDVCECRDRPHSTSWSNCCAAAAELQY